MIPGLDVYKSGRILTALQFHLYCQSIWLCLLVSVSVLHFQVSSLQLFSWDYADFVKLAIPTGI